MHLMSNPYEEDRFENDDGYREPENDDEHEMVLACGLEGCVMPGEHMRSECHTAEMLEAQAEEHENEDFETWFEDWQRKGFTRAYGSDEPFRSGWGSSFKRWMREAWMARAGVRTGESL
jgi:hypothetical protein